MAEEEKTEEQEQSQEQLSEIDTFADEWAESRGPDNPSDADLRPSGELQPEIAGEENQQQEEQKEEETVTETPVEASEEKVETPTAEQTVEEPVSQPKVYTVPDDDIYGELRGKKATAAELDQAGMLDRLLTREHQELHHVKLYQELKKDFDSYKEGQAQEKATAEQAAAQENAAIPPEQMAAMIESHYGPQLEAMAEAGSFEPGFLNAYPRVASAMEHRFQSGGRALIGLVKQVHELSEYVGMKQTEDNTESAKVSVESKMDSLVDELPALADGDVRGRFVQWAIDEENPLTNRMSTKDETELTAQDLRGAFAAYVAITGDGLQVTTPAPVVAKERQARGRMAAGGSGGGGGGSTPTAGTALNEIDAFEQEFQESRR